MYPHANSEDAHSECARNDADTHAHIDRVRLLERARHAHAHPSSSASSRSTGSFRPTATIRAPFAANILAVAMPMPEVAPVTIASFPARQIGDAIGRRCVCEVAEEKEGGDGQAREKEWKE